MEIYVVKIFAANFSNRAKMDLKVLLTCKSKDTLQNGHRSTKRGQIEKKFTKEITMQGRSYDPKGSFGSEKMGG